MKDIYFDFAAVSHIFDHESYAASNDKNVHVLFIFLEGFKDAAEKFRDEAGIKLSNAEETNLNTMDDRIKVRECIQRGKIGEATSLVHQLHPELLDDDRYLFFHLQVSFFHSHKCERKSGCFLPQFWEAT